MSPRALTYLIALLLGLAAVWLVLPAEALLGTGPAWTRPSPDIAQSVAGHLAYQYDAWRWPILDARTLFWPRGVSIALTDSNPLFSLIAKTWVSVTGRPPVNLLGAWVATYWLLQPVSAAYAARGLRLGPLPCAAAAVLAICWPALLFRVGHLNLCGHFILLFSLGLVFRRCSAWPTPGIARRWAAPGLVLLAAVMIQPYLYLLAAALFAAIPAQRLLSRERAWRGEALGLIGATVLPVLLLTLMSGPLGGGDRGFVFFSMNLLSPVWPQISGVFGAQLPILDATGGQYEGYNWLGAGTLLLLIAAILSCLRRPPALRPWRGFIAVAVGLTMMALSSRIYAGQVLLLNLGAKPWEDIFSVFRSSGRGFWPVGYALMLFAVAGVARLPRWIAAPLLVVACVLQFVDTGPLRAHVLRTWTSGTTVPVASPELPAGARLLTVAPYPGCSNEFVVRAAGEQMLLDAAWAGRRLGEIGLGRPPSWFNCEAVAADALELPLVTGEVRAYFGATTRARLHRQFLGATTHCGEDADAVVCGRDVGALPGAALPAAEPLVAPSLPRRLVGPALGEVLQTGWLEKDGAAWTEGPFSSLILALPPGEDVAVTLSLSGFATAPGGTREIAVTAGRTPLTTLSLADRQAQEVVLHVPAADIPDGLLRLSFSTWRPVDPTKRGIAAPVSRAAIRLEAIAVDQAKRRGE